LPVLPPNWTIERDKTAGQVRYMLLRRTGVAAQADGSRTP
jgi:hypothetical protein